jgi:SHS2 domain-containing protein
VYRWVDHTAELELQLEAATEEGIFAEGLAALGELLGERSSGAPGDPARHEVSASAPDRPTLLAEWLSELLFLAETEQFIPERIDAFDLSGDQLEATVSGTRASPPHLVKAVTYHRLEMHEQDETWRARVVLDV